MRLSCAAALAAAALSLAAACSRTPSGPSEPTVTMTAPPGDDASASIRIAGLSPQALDALDDRASDSASWQDVVRIDVLPAGADAPPAGSPPMAGRFVVNDSVVAFEPSFPFEPSTRYRVHVDATRLPGGAASVVDAVVARSEKQVLAPLPIVTSIVPGGTALPENILRVYLYFSTPMDPRGIGTVRLLDESGFAIEDVFLPLDAELWNPEHTRYTLLFDPGRVKIGVRPNKEMGRALDRGRLYIISVEDDWVDAHGRTLAAPYRHEFYAGGALEGPIDPQSWEIAPPRAGTRDALVVTFPYALDQALMVRALGVERRGEAVAGEIEIASRQTEWRFTPAAPWERGQHHVVALGILEDPAGNRIGRAFELAPGRESKEVERTTIPFMIAP